MLVGFMEIYKVKKVLLFLFLFKKKKAEELLRGYPYGTFLIRFSSQPGIIFINNIYWYIHKYIGCFASSYVDQNGIVIKSLIKKVNK